MTHDQIRSVMRRLDGIWPPRKPATREEREEWARFLEPLDGEVSLRAVYELRESSIWRPSMADFRSAYWQAAAQPSEGALLLNAAEGAFAVDPVDVYGHKREEWSYCWRCDQAISLVDMEEMHYDEVRGLYHRECPPAGSGPHIPTKLLLERQEYWRRMKISREG